jgi:prophage regulatory protein
MSIKTLSDETVCLALPASDVAKLLNISTRHLWSLNSSGRLPRPIRFGRTTRWRADELRAWLDAGAPPRDQWEQLQAEGAR